MATNLGILKLPRKPRHFLAYRRTTLNGLDSLTLETAQP